MRWNIDQSQDIPQKYWLLAVCEYCRACPDISSQPNHLVPRRWECQLLMTHSVFPAGHCPQPPETARPKVTYFLPEWMMWIQKFSSIASIWDNFELLSQLQSCLKNQLRPQMQLPWGPATPFAGSSPLPGACPQGSSQ